MSAERYILAEYPDHEAIVRAVRRVREAGFSRIETYTPFPSEELDELLPGPPTPIGWCMFVGGFCGGSLAYFMEWYAAHDFAYNVGGRPLTSWPAFVPVMFELTVLATSLTGLVALFILCRLPRLDHPVFQCPEFVRASQDRFFLAVEREEEADRRAALLAALGRTEPLLVEEVGP